VFKGKKREEGELGVFILFANIQQSREKSNKEKRDRKRTSNEDAKSV
jgi:hypothetical protein